MMQFKCKFCGKITAGRIPRENRFSGDGSLRYPRKHNYNGKPCPGNYEEAEWIEIYERKNNL